MTGLVYLAIIALWVMFLIPWLGRHRDEHNGRKSADRYHRAMDTLARARDTIRHPDHEDHAEHPDDEAEADFDEELSPSALDLGAVSQGWHAIVGIIRPSVSARRSVAARRRRTVLLVLAAGFAAGLSAAAFGFLPPLVPVAFAGLLVIYVTLVLRQARSAVGEPSRGVSAEADRYRQATRRAQDQARGLYAGSPADQPSSSWEARSTPLPTYFSKPKATKVPRVVDLASGPRPWTGEDMVQRAMAERQRAEAQAAAAAQFDREIAAVEPDRSQELADLANATPPAQRQPYRRVVNG